MIPVKRVVAAIDAHPKSHLLLRSASAKAREIDCPWSVLFIDEGNLEETDPISYERVARHLATAEMMGAEILRIESHQVVDSIVQALEQYRKEGIQVVSLIMGQLAKDGWLADFRASTAEKTARRLRKTDVMVHIIPLSGRYVKSSWMERYQPRDIRLNEILFSLLSVVIATIASELLHLSVGMAQWPVSIQNVSAFYLIATVVSALRYGLIAGLIAGTVGFTVINYFYTQPLHAFEINHNGDGINLIVFLLSAFLVSVIGAYSRAGAITAARKERRSQLLYKVHRLASAASDRDEALDIVRRELHALLNMEVAFFISRTMQPEALEQVMPKKEMLSQDEAALLALSWKDMRATGLGASHGVSTRWRFEPMVTPNGEIGVLALKIPTSIRLDVGFSRMLSALADQAANILERIELTRLMGESQVREEREKLRAMLLSSVSHDLKTPLASIIGSLSVYMRMKKAGRLDEATANELVYTALEEGQRLDSFISNILDMTRIESGEIVFDSSWVDPLSPIKNVQKRLRTRLGERQLIISEPQATLEVKMDRVMTEQVLQNTIDNAVKYSPERANIELRYGLQNGAFEYVVRDFGNGIPEAMLERVFDKYERLKQSDSTVAGTGLGLAICKAVMEKQGGTILARNHPEGGAEFIIRFPEARIVDDSGGQNE